MVTRERNENHARRTRGGVGVDLKAGDGGLREVLCATPLLLAELNGAGQVQQGHAIACAG
jgi:hypothetical protein